MMLLFCICANIGYAQSSDFVTKWDLSKTGTAGNNSISFNTTNATGSISYTWQELSPGSSSGSGSFSAGTGATRTISGLPASATIELRIASTNLQRFYINNGSDKLRLTDVTQWGSTAWTSMSTMFNGCSNLNVTATDLPDLSGVQNMSNMFNACTILNGPSNIGAWNTANVTTMGEMFSNATAFNQDIGAWNTANVTTMQQMFAGASAFNQNIGAWSTANVTTISSMFQNATAFNQNIGAWNTANATTMQQMFDGAKAFNQNIGAWNTANVTTMSSMFQNATAFNQDINNWNTSKVTNMSYMFNGASAFNKNIGSWNTGSVFTMTSMFNRASAFNQNIGSWNTGSVIHMYDMFNGATAFNQNIGGWNMGNVLYMDRMFKSAKAFDQNIGNWNTSKVTSMTEVFSGATSFNQNIGSWNMANVTTISEMFSGATRFNQNIGSWDISKLTSLRSAFFSATAFNQNIGNWNTSRVSEMTNMFNGATAFNQNIGNWNTSNVTSMSYMFVDATSFNQDIGNWNTSNLLTMEDMFQGASAFNQNLGNWVLNSSVNLYQMLSGCGMNCDNYSRTLAGWALSTSATSRSLGATGQTYGTNVNSLRTLLTTATGSGGKGWTISGDAAAAGTCGPTIYYSKSSGNLDDPATWGTNTDGTGTNPIDFTTANQVFAIRNGNPCTLGGNWSVSGSDAYIVLGDGSTAITLSTGTNAISGSYRLTNNATLNIESNSTGLSFVCESGSTVNYNGTGSQTIAPGQYHHLTLSNSRGGGTMTLGSGVVYVRGTMTNNLSSVGSWVNTGNTFFYVGAGAQTIANFDYNHLIIGGIRTSTPAITLASGTIKVVGECLNGISGAVTWVHAGNNFEYNGTISQTIAAINYNNLTVSGNKNNNTLTLQSGTTLISGTASFTASNVGGWVNTGSTIDYNGTGAQTVMAMNYNNLTISGARSGSPTITLQNAGTIGVAGTLSVTATGTYTLANTGSTIEYNGTGAQSVAAMNYNNLTISGNKNNNTLTLQNGTINIAGDATFTASGVGSWINNGNTVNYNGSVAQQIGAFNYNNLTSSSSGARTLPSTGTIGVAGTFTPGTNSYTVTGSTINFNGSSAQSINAFNYHNLTSSNSGARTLPATGTIGVAGAFTPGSNAYTTTGSTIAFNGVGAQTINAFNYNNLTISSNKNNNALTLQSGTITVGGTLTLSATNISSWTTTGNTLEYNGSGSQTVLSSIPYRNLNIAGSNTKTLNGNTSVAGDLTLSNKLVLGASNLTLSGNASGGSSSNYVVVGGSGTMKKNIGTSSAFNFPVGNSAYNPVSITNNTSSSDEFSVRILDEVMYGGTTGMVATEPRVKRTWLIDKTTPNANSGSGVDFTFNWNSGEMVSITTPALYHFNGISWQKQTGTTSSNSTSLSYTGYTGTFSPFAIGDDIILLPVSWLYMRCNSAKPVTNTIQWAMASQTNSRSFVVERSSNGKTFVALDSLAAAGNSHNANHYSYVDEHADLPEAYYRIKQVDENGSEHLSEICLVQTKSSKDSPMVSIYPNPAASVVFLSAGEKSLPYNWALYNTTGQLLTSGNSDGGQASINLGNIGKGIYNLHVQGEGFVQNVKLLVNP